LLTIASHGVIHILLLSATAHLTKELGMAPGGEFRAAFREAQKVPNCNIILGDRPVSITLKRAINSLSLWQKCRLAWTLLTSKDKITSNDVENCMKQDILESLLLEMRGEYPALSRVFVEERNEFLAYTLRKCAQAIPIETTDTGFVPAVVVGVVGMGHVAGIVKNWDSSPTDIAHLMNINTEIAKSSAQHCRSTTDYASFVLKLACVSTLVAAIFQFTRTRLR